MQTWPPKTLVSRLPCNPRQELLKLKRWGGEDQIPSNWKVGEGLGGEKRTISPSLPLLPAFQDLNFGGFSISGKKEKKFEKQTLRLHFTLHKTSLKSKMVADTRVVVIVGTRTGQGRGSAVSRRSRCGEGAASGSPVRSPTRLLPAPLAFLTLSGCGARSPIYKVSLGGGALNLI